jgi:hypothetical protein
MELLTNDKRNADKSLVYCEPELHVESNSKLQTLSSSFHSRPAGQGMMMGVPDVPSELTVHWVNVLQF